MKVLIVMLASACIASCCFTAHKPESATGTVVKVWEIASRDGPPPSWWHKTLTLDTDSAHHYTADPRDVTGLPDIEKGDAVFITYKEEVNKRRRITSIRKQ